MSVVLGRPPSDGEVESFSASADRSGFDGQQIVHALLSASEVVRRELNNAVQLHLFAIHRARVALIATLLPPAGRILDLGGAASPLCDTGYPHPFEELVIIDLPPEDRHEEFAGRIVSDRQTETGEIRVAYTSMCDLSLFATDSIDLVWSGQSLEHLDIAAARLMYDEVLRVLKPEGSFCLDTPNRLVTKIHGNGQMIHGDHRHEYEPEELRQNLTDAGFDVVESFGLCSMPLTVRSGAIDYRDFVMGAGLTTDLATAYIQYHRCVPSTKRMTSPEIG